MAQERLRPSPARLQPDYPWLPERQATGLYETALREQGFGHLVPLLEKEKEITFLQSLSQWVSDSLERPDCPPPPLAGRYRVRPRIIPPELLFGIYGQNPFTEGEVRLTTIGKQIGKLLEDRQNLFFLLIDGSATEATEIKPPPKRKSLPLATSFHPEAVHRGRTYPGEIPQYSYFYAPVPEIDIDILALTKNPNLSLEAIQGELATGKMKRTYHCRVEVVTSGRRPKFSYVQIRTPTTILPSNLDLLSRKRHQGIPFGQIAFAENCEGAYGAQFGLIHFLLSREPYPSPVLLVPIVKHPTEDVNFIGVALDFYSDQRLQRNIKIFQGETERKLLIDPVFWPDFTYPQGCWPEKLEHFLHGLKSWTWTNALPLIEINQEGQEVISLREVLKPESHYYPEIRELSRRTAAWFHQEIISPIVAQPDLLGGPSRRESAAVALVDRFLPPSLNGDPYLGLIRLLPEGFYVKGIPVYGMGFVGEGGFFPKLGRFLEETDGYQKRQDRLLLLMKKTRYGTANEGWKTFTNYLFAQTNNDAQSVAELLTPSFYPGSVNEFALACLAPNDRRFSPLLEPKQKESLIFGFIFRSPVPLNINQLADLSGLGHDELFRLLEELEKDRAIIDLSLDPHLRPISNFHNRWTGQWFTKGKEEELPETESFLAPLSQVYRAILYHRCQTPAEITQITGLPIDQVHQSLQDLMREKIVGTQGFRNQIIIAITSYWRIYLAGRTKKPT